MSMVRYSAMAVDSAFEPSCPGVQGAQAEVAVARAGVRPLLSEGELRR
jgi:hypothetical protein